MNYTNVEEIWQKACVDLQKNLSQNAYEAWILSNPLTEFRLVGDDRAIGVITSPTAFHSTNVEKNFYAQIKEVLDNITGRNSELQFRIGDPAQMQQTSQQSMAVSTPRVAPLSTNISSLQERLKEMAMKPPEQDAVSTAISTTSYTSPHATQSEQLNQTAATQPAIAQTQSQKQIPLETGLFAPTTVRSVAVDRARLQAQRAGLRLDYTFDTFAVSTTNEMAHAAALAVSDQPGTAYNPLFIYGGVGVGKTHLMHAVGNNILKNNPDTKILYCTGEDFTNEIVNAIQIKKTMLFKEKYRNADVWLIDDVQFIGGKNTVQEEFFHTFNTITKKPGQIILTSDQPPHEIGLLEDRLRSRFEAGLMVDIQQPSFELRTAILLIKAISYNLQIPMNLAQVIASKVDSARKIEGIMKQIKSEVELKHKEINQQLIDEIFKSESSAQTKPKLRVKPYDVIKTVAEYYHLKPSVVKGPQRVKSIVRARHVAMYFLKEDLHLPYMEVARWFDNRDHTSAMHAAKKVLFEMAEDNELRQDVSSLRTELQRISK